ncbi:MAG TPA: RNA-binding cell elongation regulator Jag/EloR [Nitrospinota bacterium]|nr:RNA-binding cell elongation regulator Jag/EloR [Nitrospinota bacterium]|tara:strand:- start:241469 stop:242434 length:966 start_codon:yes stop_codon:yes gene_type:complete
MDWVESEGTTREEAEKRILETLGLSNIENVEIEELRVTRKFLGMGGRTVRLRGRIKSDEKVESNNMLVSTQQEPPVEAEPEQEQTPLEFLSGTNKYRPWVTEGASAIIIPQEGRGFGKRKYSSTPDDQDRYLDDNSLNGENENVDRQEEPDDEDEFQATDYTDDIDSPATDEDRDKAVTFMQGMLEHMGIEGSMVGHKLSDRLLIQINSESGGLLIGRRGGTLDSMQYLVDIAVNRKRTDRLRVILDTEHYKEKRRFHIYQVAMDAAKKVITEKRSLRLQPMSPAERQIVHSTLADNQKVETISEGQGNRRRVVVYLNDER